MDSLGNRVFEWLCDNVIPWFLSIMIIFFALTALLLFVIGCVGAVNSLLTPAPQKPIPCERTHE